jgi:hypothetical protein
MPTSPVRTSRSDQLDGDDDDEPMIRLITPRYRTPGKGVEREPSSSPEPIRLSPSHLRDPALDNQQPNALTAVFPQAPAFIFGSPAAVSEAQFGSVADKVLREMHRRVAAANTNGGGGGGGGSLRNLFSCRKPVDSAAEVGEKPEERFEGKHKRQFDK